MKIKTLFLLCMIFISSFCFGDKYTIKLKLKNAKASRVMLAHYYDGKVFSIDTATLNIHGEARFSKPKRLHSGLYIVYLDTKQYFDVFIGNEQNITIKTDINDPVVNMEINGSNESMEFVNFQLFLFEMNKRKQGIIESKPKEIDKQLYIVDKDVRDKIFQISVKYPNSSLASFVKFSLEPEIPCYNEILQDNIVNGKDSINKLKYFYLKNHYWDNAVLSDSTLIYTPMLKSKLDVFFKNTIIPHPDTVYNESVKLIEKSRMSKEMFKYISSYCFNFTINSKIMGMDNAFYKIANKYYLSGDAYWISDTTKSKIQQEALKIQYNRLGEKAKNLTLQTIDGEWINLYDIQKSLTVLVFWEPDCGHCKKEMPLLKTEIADKFYDVEIIAIYTQEDRLKWTNYIEENDLYKIINCYDPNNSSNFRFYYNVSTTPLIYLLDKDKKIIAKNIDIEALSKIIKNEYSIE